MPEPSPWDWPESTVEALYQVATGIGYDQNCNGLFDPADDVAPFIASSTDAFGGTVPGTYDPTVPGTGSLGGNGFRDGAVPILIYTTDATLRNGQTVNEGPGGCPFDATTWHLPDALSAISAKAIGVAAGTSQPLGAMLDIAMATDSWLDLNDDGTTDSNEWMVYSSSSYNVVDQVVDSISEFTQNVTYDLEMETDDPAGVIVSIDPVAYYDIPAFNTVTFTVTLQPTPLTASTIFSDTVFIVPTTLLGDGEVILWQGDLSFLIEAGP